MAVASEAYVDSAAFVAFIDRADTHHTTFARHFGAPPKLVTTPLVVTETHAWLLRRHDGTRALQFLAFIEQLRPLQIVSVGRSDVAAATAIARRFADQELTLVDATGLHVMRDRGIKLCWSTDRHLRLGGARLLIDE